MHPTRLVFTVSYPSLPTMIAKKLLFEVNKVEYVMATMILTYGCGVLHSLTASFQLKLFSRVSADSARMRVSATYFSASVKNRQLRMFFGMMKNVVNATRIVREPSMTNK